MPGTSHSSSATSSSSSSSMSVRLIFTCLAIVIVFTLCWVPQQTTLFVTIAGNIARPRDLLLWFTLFSCFNSCVNPIIYGLMWRPFRAALRDVSAVYNKEITDHCLDTIVEWGLVSRCRFIAVDKTDQRRLATHRLSTNCCRSISRRCYRVYYFETERSE